MGLNYIKLQDEIVAIYGKHAVSRPATSKWRGQLENGRTDIIDEYCSPADSINAETVANLEQVHRDN